MKTIPGFLHAADAIVPCKACGAREGQPCVPQDKDLGRLKPGYVHFGRRLSRLLLTRERWWERDKLEEELVDLLAKELAEKRAN